MQLRHATLLLVVTGASLRCSSDAATGPGFVTETVVLRRDGARRWRAAGYFVKPE